ncbi:MAG TPA: UpxY family transcription antiterminator [Blastocatellia bacterium]|nr:UpxY family transcription antiterminator [Blastocatellia bacterium]
MSNRNRYPWFALQTKPKNEKKVESLLKQKNYECFAPVYRLKRKWSDRTVEIDSPLFPGYVFCQFNPSVLGKAISTQGVVRIVGFGGKPIEVSLEEIEALDRLSQSHLLREPWKYLPEGTRVLVETGPLAGVQGIICTDKNTSHLIISVTLLQRSVAIQLDENTAISIVAGPDETSERFRSESDLAINLLRVGPKAQVMRSR